MLQATAVSDETRFYCIHNGRLQLHALQNLLPDGEHSTASKRLHDIAIKRLESILGIIRGLVV